MSSQKSVTVIIGDAPYGSERSFSALRFVLTALLEEIKVNIFFLENGTYVGLKDQNPVEFANIENLVREAIESGAKIIMCGPCCQARGITKDKIVDGIHFGTMHDLTDLVMKSDKVIFF
ncbi:DsrE/DsrF/TusD sulfur relay family protein [Methanospirillum lacunae]|uniref:Uncharacterized protein n=1 Tax=Methanospirillum lacunae TaxID=668570 RepID=A0A2V2N1A0_9EURY|nr:DsrE family protein [Methanospirillum lacunae]PWR73942.1 hypothetical protein DK846_01895 [Methanospirillum lacunae]